MKKIRLSSTPLTTEQLESLSAHDIGRIKLSEEEISKLKEINKKRQQDNIERASKWRVEEKSLVKDLHQVGYKVQSIWDLVNSLKPYPEAVPILLKHLLLPYSDRTREGIARSLARPEPKALEAWPILVEQYYDAPMGKGIIAPGDTKEFRLGTKDALALALSALATEEKLDELIDLAKDRRLGESRVLLLSALRKSRNSMAIQAIMELKNDPDLSIEIASWEKGNKRKNKDPGILH